MGADTLQRRMFAPMGKPPSPDESRPVLEGVIFDMDGTLCEPQNYMFQEMRATLGITRTTDILDHIHSLPEPQQTEAFAKIEAIERTAMANQIPQAGLVLLMEFLDQHGIKKAICTRNFDMPVNNLLKEHIPRHIAAFSPVITRGFRPPKPSPAGIFNIAYAWGITDTPAVPPTAFSERPLNILMVGDSEDDMAAGRDAGAMTVLLRSPGKEDLEVDARTDVVISRLDELIRILKQGIEARS